MSNWAKWYVFILAAAVGACGTVVGNPKKPDEGTNPPAAIVQIPLLEYEIPAEAVGDTTSLHLQGLTFQGDPSIGAQRTVLESWGKRSRGLVREINRASMRFNTILEKVEADEDGDYLFVREGDNGKVAGRVSQSGDDYQATICVNDSPIITMNWSDVEGSAISLTRDFSTPTDADQVAKSFVSHVTFQPGEQPQLTIETQGMVEESDSFSGGGFNEYAETQKVGEALEVRVVGDWYETQPEDGAFAGKTYLTGRLYRDGDDGGDRRGQAEFVAYNAARKLLCRFGFDEDSSTLWGPEPQDEPRWCLGRPLGRDQFTDYDDFLDTLSSLEEVGIVKAEKLRVLSIDPSSSCTKP